jgi:hypothetical protein
MENVIRGTFGLDAVVVFLQGACGDVTQVDNLSPYAFPSGEQWARFVGGRIGATNATVSASSSGASLNTDGHHGSRFPILRIDARQRNQLGENGHSAFFARNADDETILRRGPRRRFVR